MKDSHFLGFFCLFACFQLVLIWKFPTDVLFFPPPQKVHSGISKWIQRKEKKKKKKKSSNFFCVRARSLFGGWKKTQQQVMDKGWSVESNYCHQAFQPPLRLCACARVIRDGGSSASGQVHTESAWKWRAAFRVRCSRRLSQMIHNHAAVNQTMLPLTPPPPLLNKSC